MSNEKEPIDATPTHPEDSTNISQDYKGLECGCKDTEFGPMLCDRHFKEVYTMEDPKGFVVKDSGKRQTFASGMVRDTQENKIDFTRVLDGPMFDRWAAHLTKGETKYPDIAPGVPNWLLADGEAELIRFKKSAFRHFRQWFRGDFDEDHASACFFNINGYEYVKEKMKKGE